MSEQDIAVAEAAVRFWNAGERQSFLALFHAQGVWSSAIKREVEGGEGLYRGRDEVGDFWDEWHSVWDDLEIVVSEFRSPADGLRLRIRSTSRQRHKQRRRYGTPIRLGLPDRGRADPGGPRVPQPRGSAQSGWPLGVDASDQK